MGEKLLRRLLEVSHEHSTVVGKVWLPVLFISRILVLGATSVKSWEDGDSIFLCNTAQVGCQEACHNKLYPISHTRFWMLQIIFVFTPTLVYLGYILQLLCKQPEKELNEGKDMKGPVCKKQGLNQHGALQRPYVFSIAFKIVFETGFIAAQCFLFAFDFTSSYECNLYLCHSRVSCVSSRPAEKAIFTLLMLVVACISLLLCLVEMCFVGFPRCCLWLGRRRYDTVSERELKCEDEGEHPLSPEASDITPAPAQLQ